MNTVLNFFRITLFFTFSISVCFSQSAKPSHKVEASVHWGTSHKNHKAGVFSKVIGTNSKGTYVLRESNFITEVQLFDQDLNYVNHQIITPSVDGKKAAIREVVLLNDQLYFFVSKRDSKKEKIIVYYSEINQETFAPLFDYKELCTFPVLKKRESPDISVQLSKDQQKFLLLMSQPVLEGPEVFGFKVYDANFQLHSEKLASEPQTERLLHENKYELLNNGDVIIKGKSILSKAFNSDSKRSGKNKIKQHTYHLILYYDQGSQIKDFEFKLGEKYITQLEFIVDEEQNFIYCGGFYSEKGIESIKGVYKLRIDRVSRKIQQASYKPFPKKVLHADASKRKIKKSENGIKKELELEDYILRDIVLTKKGEIQLVGEQYQLKITSNVKDMYQNSLNAFPTTYYQYMLAYRYYFHSFPFQSNNSMNFDYFFKDIIIVTFDQKGELKWVKRIDKFQHSSNDDGLHLSFATKKIDDHLVLFYNERAHKVLSKEERKNQDIGKNDIVGLALGIDDNGTIQKNTIYHHKPGKETFVPSAVNWQFQKNGVLYLPAQRRNNEKLGRITFKLAK